MRTYIAASIAALTSATQLYEDVPVGLKPISSIPDFFAGFMYGFISENNLPEIERCGKDAKLSEDKLKGAIKAFKKGNKVIAIAKLKEFVKEIKITASDCHDLQDDLDAI